MHDCVGIFNSSPKRSFTCLYFSTSSYLIFGSELCTPKALCGTCHRRQRQTAADKPKLSAPDYAQSGHQQRRGVDFSHDQLRHTRRRRRPRIIILPRISVSCATQQQVWATRRSAFSGPDHPQDYRSETPRCSLLKCSEQR
jgi:hypothetical protein